MFSHALCQDNERAYKIGLHWCLPGEPRVTITFSPRPRSQKSYLSFHVNALTVHLLPWPHVTVLSSACPRPLAVSLCPNHAVSPTALSPTGNAGEARCPFKVTGSQGRDLGVRPYEGSVCGNGSGVDFEGRG